MRRGENKWVFPKIVVPQNGWFIRETPIKMDDLGGPPLFLETPKWTFRNLVRTFGFFQAHLSAIREEHRVQKKRGKWETLAHWMLLYTETKKQQFCIFWHSCDFELYTGATELPCPNLQS